MERAILVIVLMVAVVGVVGLFSSYNFMAGQDALSSGGLTGNSIASAQQCANCAGSAPVCARLNNRYLTYPNACAAVCAGAEVAVQKACEQIL
jgi:hypothetical protein